MKNQEWNIDLEDLFKSENRGQIMELEIDEEFVPEEKDNIKMTTPLHVELSLRESDDLLFVNFEKVSGKVELECQRCMQRYEHEIKLKNKEVLFAADEKMAEKMEAEFLYDWGEKEVNVYDALREEIILSLPVSPMCNDECRGICPKCGKNLNEGRCECDDVNKIDDNPFASLSELL